LKTIFFRYQIVFYLVLLLSCNYKRNINIEQEKFNSITQNVWDKLGIKANTDFKIENKNLLLDINYVENYFLLDETNHLINSYLLFSMDTLATCFDSVIINTRFTNLAGIQEVKYSKENVISIQKETAGNQLFCNMFVFILNNINNYDDIGFDDLIKDLKELAPDAFQHQGSFWLLLHNYSLNCCDSTSIAYKSMHMLERAAQYPKRPWHPEIIDSLINYCEGKCESQK